MKLKINKFFMYLILISILVLIAFFFLCNKKDNDIQIEGKNNVNYCDYECMHNLTKEECLKRGGSWGRHGMDLGIDECNLKTSDFNKFCKKSSDCESYCLCENKFICKILGGKCSEYRMKFGHFYYLDENGNLKEILQD